MPDRWGVMILTLQGEPAPELPALPGRVMEAFDEPLDREYFDMGGKARRKAAMERMREDPAWQAAQRARMLKVNSDPVKRARTAEFQAERRAYADATGYTGLRTKITRAMVDEWKRK